MILNVKIKLINVIYILNIMNLYYNEDYIIFNKTH